MHLIFYVWCSLFRNLNDTHCLMSKFFAKKLLNPPEQKLSFSWTQCQRDGAKTIKTRKFNNAIFYKSFYGMLAVRLLDNIIVIYTEPSSKCKFWA